MPANSACVHFPAVVSNGTHLLVNVASSSSSSSPPPTRPRFFAAGMVESGGAPLLEFNATHFDGLLALSERIGANTLRWNAFLKGLDFAWDTEQPPMRETLQAEWRYPPAYPVKGLRPGSLDALVQGLDMAARRGVLLQIVLSTAHFLRFGFGGEGFEIHGITNRDRVHYTRALLGTSQGLDAYIRTVLEPLLARVGRHPALLGFLIVNEGYSMVDKEDSVLPRTSDVTIPLKSLQRFINVAASTIRKRLPEALLASSLKLRTNSRWNERNGVHGIGVWFSDEALVAAGGQADGVLDIRQYQYYPESSFGADDSPFLKTADELRFIHKQSKPKPSLAGEFPLPKPATISLPSSASTSPYAMLREEVASELEELEELEQDVLVDAGEVLEGAEQITTTVGVEWLLLAVVLSLCFVGYSRARWRRLRPLNAEEVVAGEVHDLVGELNGFEEEGAVDSPSERARVQSKILDELQKLRRAGASGGSGSSRGYSAVKRDLD